MTQDTWKIFRGDPENPHDDITTNLPSPPSWRTFDNQKKGITYQARGKEIELVNAALYLRRPLLVTGKPGTGKTSKDCIAMMPLDECKIVLIEARIIYRKLANIFN